jgi:hypothetical protein
MDTQSKHPPSGHPSNFFRGYNFAGVDDVLRQINWCPSEHRKEPGGLVTSHYSAFLYQASSERVGKSFFINAGDCKRIKHPSSKQYY